MDRVYRVGVMLVLATALPYARVASAQTAAQKSLTNCQDTVRKATEKFIAGEVKAMGGCLKKIASAVLKTNTVITTSIALNCVKSFRKVNDSRGLGKSLPEKLLAKITAKCDPALTSHTTDDITGKGAPGVPQPIQTQRLDLFCRHFGGDGSIDTFSEWTGCLQTAIECEAREAIAVEYPRAPEWFDDVLPVMALLPVNPDDPMQIPDAMAGVSAADAAIDPDGNDIPDITCGGGGATCVTGCCYFENLPPVGPETSCVQYSGPTASVFGAFALSCAGNSLPGAPGFQFHTFTPVPCGPVSPVRGQPCVGAPNRLLIPTDSSCP